MVGILVHGNNHFVLSGPRPDENDALALARHFSLIQIGSPKPRTFEQWQIREKEFRENLTWAVVVPGDRITPVQSNIYENATINPRLFSSALNRFTRWPADRNSA